jgi:hypothetical protein
MDAVTARFPSVKLFSLPSFLPDGKRRIELGVRGPKADVDRAYAALHEGVVQSGFPWQPL